MATLRQTDVLDPARATALDVILGHRRGDDGLPPFYHQIYFWDPEPPQALGRDGHPRVGGLIPDMGLPRRMWAGGALTFHVPLQVGAKAEKISRCLKSERKTGRSGPLGFVTLEHQIHQNGVLCVTERQDLVYRMDHDPTAPKPSSPEARRDSVVQRHISFDSTMLFRYSALTFNGHRIHYDLAYAREVEGYDGLVVHGPLLAQLLMLLAAEGGCLASFEFRATAPLLHFEAALVCQNDKDLWIAGPDGRRCMQAQVAYK
ncbi:MAG: acyl dehydratase [Rhodobacteraceae bacterium]|nr:acyl dehydratase [Paracoccaceae bacterium]